MKNGYKIFWTVHALSELEETIAYLEENWTAQELEIFAKELDHTLELISKNPKIFQISFKGKNIRRAVVAKFNSLYYRIHNDSIEILSFFSNRQDPSKIKID
jgi:plasmid stabilization system protein ParE